MPLTRAHLERITGFCEARIDDLFDGERSYRYADDDLSHALRALRSVVVHLGSRDVLLADGGHAERMSANFAWRDLREIAREWRGHPDYLPEFAQETWDLVPDSAGEQAR
jgi:hypothetical protein